MTSIDRLQRRGCRAITLAGRTTGAGLLRLEGDDAAVTGAIGDLRESTDVGHVVILRTGRGIKEQLDVWGPASGAAEVARVFEFHFSERLKFRNIPISQ